MSLPVYDATNPQYTCIMGTATLWFITSGLTITTGIEVTNNPIRSTWPWSRHFLLKLTTAISWRPKKRSGVDVIKLFFGRKCKFPRNEEIEKKIVLMSGHRTKCEDHASFKQNYALKLFMAFKMAYSCCFSFSLDFLDFPQKSFITLTRY